MSVIIKSFSFPDGDIRGDMFYINHGSDNFTVIDCFLKNFDERDVAILSEIKEKWYNKTIRRFISTHPDNDHIIGLNKFVKYCPIDNFYAVPNNVPSDDNDEDLTCYLELKNGPKCCSLFRDLKRPFLNGNGVLNGQKEIKSSGISILWPVLNNQKFKEAQVAVENGGKKNNICPVLLYRLNGGGSFMWMGDMETEMQQEFFDTCGTKLKPVDVLFAPHHGRSSGSTPKVLLDALDPKIIVIGNAPCQYINYQDSDRTITQNSSGDILFDNREGEILVYTSNNINNPPICLKKEKGLKGFERGKLHAPLIYQGSLKL